MLSEISQLCLVVIGFHFPVILFLFLHLELEHFFELAPSFWVVHLHLSDVLAEGNSATSDLIRVVALNRLPLFLKRLGVLFLFSEYVHVDICSVYLILSPRRLLHAVLIPLLLDRRVLRLWLKSCVSSTACIKRLLLFLIFIRLHRRMFRKLSSFFFCSLLKSSGFMVFVAFVSLIRGSQLIMLALGAEWSLEPVLVLFMSPQAIGFHLSSCPNTCSEVNLGVLRVHRGVGRERWLFISL